MHPFPLQVCDLLQIHLAQQVFPRLCKTMHQDDNPKTYSPRLKIYHPYRHLPILGKQLLSEWLRWKMSDNFPPTGVKLTLRYRWKLSTFIAPGCAVNRVKVNCSVTGKKNVSFLRLKNLYKTITNSCWVAFLTISHRFSYWILLAGCNYFEKKTL